MNSLSHPPVILMYVKDQLTLIEPTSLPTGGSRAPGRGRGRDRGREPSWVLDDRTREVGRRGLALARQALRQGATRPAA